MLGLICPFQVLPPPKSFGGQLVTGHPSHRPGLASRHRESILAVFFESEDSPYAFRRSKAIIKGALTASQGL